MSWKSMLGFGDAKPEAAPLVDALIFPDTDEGTKVKGEAPADVSAPEVPGLEWWWLLEHLGHPGFYLRTLMPGDLAPGRLPAPRHVRLLERGPGLPTEVRCGTCGEIPRSEDLEPVERQTGHRGFLSEFRSGRARWPKPTPPESCWMCSGQAPANTQARLRGTDVLVCAGCAKHLERRS